MIKKLMLLSILLTVSAVWGSERVSSTAWNRPKVIADVSERSAENIMKIKDGSITVLQIGKHAVRFSVPLKHVYKECAAGLDVFFDEHNIPLLHVSMFWVKPDSEHAGETTQYKQILELYALVQKQLALQIALQKKTKEEQKKAKEEKKNAEENKN